MRLFSVLLLLQGVVACQQPMLAQSLEELLPETDQAVVTLESLPASRVLLSQLLSTFQPADLRRLAKLNPASQQRLLNYLNNLAGESAGADSILAILRQRTERVIALLLQPNPRGRKAAFSQRIRWLRNGAAQDSRIGIDAGRLQLSAALQRDAGEKKLHDFVSGVCIYKLVVIPWLQGSSRSTAQPGLSLPASGATLLKLLRRQGLIG